GERDESIMRWSVALAWSGRADAATEATESIEGGWIRVLALTRIVQAMAANGSDAGAVGNVLRLASRRTERIQETSEHLRSIIAVASSADVAKQPQLAQDSWRMVSDAINQGAFSAGVGGFHDAVSQNGSPLPEDAQAIRRNLEIILTDALLSLAQ